MARKRGLVEIVLLVRVVLWILATRLGTLLLCGSLCFCEKWPFVWKFSEMPLKNREEALRRWFKNKVFTPIRAALALIKLVSLYIFFSRVISFSSPLFTTYDFFNTKFQWLYLLLLLF